MSMVEKHLMGFEELLGALAPLRSSARRATNFTYHYRT